QMMTAVVLEGADGKEYRLPTEQERSVAEIGQEFVLKVFEKIPFGLPEESIPAGSSRKGGGSAFTVVLYGLDQWVKLFTSRQLVSLGTLVVSSREVGILRQNMKYSQVWQDALTAYSACVLSRTVDYMAN